MENFNPKISRLMIAIADVFAKIFVYFVRIFVKIKYDERGI